MRDALGTYLNDHLAGSVGALELLDHLIGHVDDEALRQALADVRSEIAEDQATLQALPDAERRFEGLALAPLAQRAANQHARMERHRVDAARAALGRS